ncbi:hypothetical protein ACH4D5_28580 [Streptomyces sp. NPDC018029]
MTEDLYGRAVVADTHDDLLMPAGERRTPHRWAAFFREQPGKPGKWSGAR